MWYLAHQLLAIGLLATALPVTAKYGTGTGRSAKFRTVVTTDMEQDDLSSLIRFLLYTNDVDAEGIIYTSSKYHWAGDGNGTAYRWTGTRTIQDKVLTAYAEVYPNLRRQDPSYPTAEELLSKVRIGNIDFESDMSRDSAGSDLIRSLIMDDDPRELYLQAWGGTNTIARALKSIELESSGSQEWRRVKDAVSRKVVIMASGFQDLTYAGYIAPNWPEIRVQQMSAGYATWGYNCNVGQGNTRGLPHNHLFFTGAWIHPNIEMGPYGRLYRSWLDGQKMPGDPLDVFGNLTTALTGSCQPLGPYDFLSEGDNVAYNGLLTTGIQDPANPNLGSWGGRASQTTASPNLWETVPFERNQTGAEVSHYTTDRWMRPAQNDFAARMKWTVTPDYRDGNHAPSVEILDGSRVKGRPGSEVLLASSVHDPDGDEVTTCWWQYLEEGTYPGMVMVNEHGHNLATVKIPADARAGQMISIILEGTDNGEFPLTRYDRVFIEVV